MEREQSKNKRIFYACREKNSSVSSLLRRGGRENGIVKGPLIPMREFLKRVDFFALQGKETA